MYSHIKQRPFLRTVLAPRAGRFECVQWGTTPCYRSIVTRICMTNAVFSLPHLTNHLSVTSIVRLRCFFQI